MVWNWKVVLPIGIVAVLLVVMLFSQFGTKTMQITEEQQLSPIIEKPAVLPPATGNVDDAVNAMLVAVDDELSVLNEYDVDISLVIADSQVISDFGQTYDENIF